MFENPNNPLEAAITRATTYCNNTIDELATLVGIEDDETELYNFPGAHVFNREVAEAIDRVLKLLNKGEIE